MNSKDIKKLKLISTAIGQEVMQQCRLMLLEQKPLGEEGSDPGEKNKPKKFLEEKNLESFAYNKAFQNQVARIDELFSVLQRIDDSLLRIEHRLDRQKKKIQLLFSIVRYIGYSAGSCVLSDNLEYLKTIDKPITFYDQTKVNYNGIGFVDYLFIPHYKSNYHKVHLIEDLVNKCKNENIKYKAIKDGEVVIERIK